MRALSSRTAGFTDSVIRRMTRVSLQYGAVTLSQGFPDFDPPREILQSLASATLPHQYSITWGAQNFREALAAKQSRFMGMPIDPDGEIVVTCGSTAAIMASVLPQVTTISFSGSTGMPMKRLCFRASASRKFCAPQVMEY